jgi:hypothetical protein
MTGLEKRLARVEAQLVQERRAMRVRSAYSVAYLTVLHDALRAIPVSTGDRQRDKAVLTALEQILARLLDEWRRGADNTALDRLGVEAAPRTGLELETIYGTLEAEFGIHPDLEKMRANARS